MAGTVLMKAVIGPSIDRPRTSEIRVSEWLSLAAGSLTVTPQLRLLQQKSCSKIGRAATQRRPGLAVRSRMMQSAAPPKWAVSLCDRLETMIFTSETKNQRDPGSSSSPREMNHYLSNNFEPVLEMAPTAVQDLQVSGTIPECLNGEFLRVGPNPRYMPLGGYHWFDGEG